MNELLVDSSVVLKWFLTTDEPEVRSARALRQSHAEGFVTVRLLDLAVYELSNVLVRRHGWRFDVAGEQIDDLLTALGPLVRLDRSWLLDALALAERHSLSGYDAHWAAAARQLRVPLISADRQLLDAGLAESATAATQRLGLMP